MIKIACKLLSEITSHSYFFIRGNLLRAKEHYYFKVFKAAEGCTDVTFKKVKLSFKSKPFIYFNYKIVRNAVELTDCSLANAFNLHFVNIRSGIVTVKYCSSDDRNRSSIFLDLVVEPEVINVILQLKKSGACDVNGFQIRPVNYVVHL